LIDQLSADLHQKWLLTKILEQDLAIEVPSISSTACLEI
jgi:hypothetical protein